MQTWTYLNGTSEHSFARTFQDNLSLFSDIRFSSEHLTLGGLAELWRMVPTPQSMQLLIGASFKAENVHPNRLFSLSEGDPAELVLDNQLAQGKKARRVSGWLKDAAIELRSYAVGRGSQPRMAIVQDDNGGCAIVGNPEITAEMLSADGTAGMEAALATTDSEAVASMRAAFDACWQNSGEQRDIKPKILEALEAYFKDNSPQYIYFLTLWHLFGDRLEDFRKALQEDRNLQETPIWQALYTFQRHGAMALLEKLKKHRFCILADSVGLGKTYSALAVIKAYERMGKRVVVLCPKKLENNWLTYLKTDGEAEFKNSSGEPDFHYYVLRHTDLTPEKDEKTGQLTVTRLVDPHHGGKVKLDDFLKQPIGLLVIDESHNFKNRGKRYNYLLSKLAQSDNTSCHVLMLSATPVNNKIADIKHQFALGARVDLSLKKPEEGSAEAAFEETVGSVLKQTGKVVTLWQKGKGRNRENISLRALKSCLPDAYFDLLRTYTLARTRESICQVYAGATSELGTFPVRYPHDISLEKLEIGPNAQLPEVTKLSASLEQLTLAAYNPAAYLNEGVEWSKDTVGLTDRDRQNALVGLTRVNSLKRLESSVDSFVKTLRDALLKRTDMQLEAVRSGTVILPKVTEAALDLIEEEAGAPDDEYAGDLNESFGLCADGESCEPNFDRMIQNIVQQSQRYRKVFDFDKLEEALMHDREILTTLLEQSSAVKPSSDAKLQKLCGILDSRDRAPKDDANPGQRKALIFTAFADTADYLFRTLSERYGDSHSIACVTGSKGRLLEKGSSDVHTKTLKTLLRGFAPRAQRAPAEEIAAGGSIDWMIATDCISEGQNLQDCNCIINYDIHWNPVRLLQRIGRVDRIGSPNAKVDIYNFFPGKDLDSYMNLELRVRQKDALGAVIADAESGALEQTDAQKAEERDALETDSHYREDQLRQILGQVEDGTIGGDDNLLHSPVLPMETYLAELDAWLSEKAERQLECETAPLGLHAVAPAEISALHHSEQRVDNKVTPSLPDYGAFFLLRRNNLSEEEAKANPFGSLFLIAVDSEGNPLKGATPEHPMELTQDETLAVLRALCRDRASVAQVLADKFEQEGPQSLNDAVNGAKRQLDVCCETNRAKLLLGKVPFNFHTGRLSDSEALTLMTFVVFDRRDDAAREEVTQ